MMHNIPPPIFRALVALVVAVASIAAVKLGLDQEQTAGVLALVALAMGEGGLRQPQPVKVQK